MYIMEMYLLLTSYHKDLMFYKLIHNLDIIKTILELNKLSILKLDSGIWQDLLTKLLVEDLIK